MKVEEIEGVTKLIAEDGYFLCRIRDLEVEPKPRLKEVWLAKSESPSEYTELEDLLGEDIIFEEVQNTQEILNENLLEDMDEIAREQKEITEE